jgi:polysaccharide export outer membrane protein
MSISIHARTAGRRRQGAFRLATFRVFAVLFAAMAGLAGIDGALAQEPAEYKTGSGDKLRITVFGHEDLSGDFLVDGAGYVSLPLIGNVKAGDSTARELELAIIGKLMPDYLKNPRVGVEVLNYRPFYILGEVKNPGSYPYVSGMKVINAIALSGGYTYRGRENKVLITRAADPERKQIPADHDTVVLPGDVIEVPERFF